MLEVEIDGNKLTVPSGSTVIEAANSIGVHIPHFCYHKKLSIAANCRMCLVQVEKLAKPLPACATPVTDGMKVWTHSDSAVKAQKGVMEFLLINHPLDCPICDQGGECQLQDLAVGYGQNGSRYEEEKRVVTNKNLGPLISTDMTRCIHCTRCIRFTEEIAGFQELGMPGRGEHVEVMAFVGKTVNSEISGNVIDLCPVGALTSKPFRYSARTWELSRRKSVSPHDGLGSNLIVQVKDHQVKRVLPLENEAINECWLSDRDRFSYEALGSSERLQKPQIKHGGVWHEVDWTTALDYIVRGLKSIITDHGADSVAALASPTSTLEEMFLLKKLAAGLGVKNTAANLRQQDAAFTTTGVQWLGQSIAELADSDVVLVIGSTLRKELPLLAQRLRQSVQKKGLKLSVVNPHNDDWLTKLDGVVTTRPDQLVEGALEVLKAVAEQKGVSVPTHLDVSGVVVSKQAAAIATSLLAGEKSTVMLGHLALEDIRAAQLHAVVAAIAEITDSKLGLLAGGGNAAGAQLTGFNASSDVFAQGKKAYVLLNTEIDFDVADTPQALAAVKQAAMVVVLSSFQSSSAADYADVILPVAPFTETAGTFINLEGRAQSFNGVVRPLGETRPAWKVFRVLGNLLGLEGFEYASSEEVRDEVLAGGIEGKLNNAPAKVVDVKAITANGLARLAEVPLYQTDALVRRAPSLQATADAQMAATLRANAATLAALGLVAGAQAKVVQGGEAIMTVAQDDALLDQVVRIAAAHPLTRSLDGAAALQVSKA